MTYNVGGGIPDFDSKSSAIAKVIKEVDPDILVTQEATEYEDANGVRHRNLDDIVSDKKPKFREHFYFGPTLSMKEHLHLRKRLFVHAIFKDWQDWKQGNAILSRWEFTRLSAPSIPGTPRNIPLYQTPLYRGNRDTDPRYAILARIDKSPVFPFVVGVHLTTLVDERGQDAIPGKAEEAQKLRSEQTRRLLDLLRENVLEPKELVFLLGDFNAAASEPCISSVLEREGGFVRLAPIEELSTIHEVPKPIDHIFVYPENRLVDYHCWIVDSPVAQKASDHLPVVADVNVI
jgi:endonuclease/exonuclease/phosphatase family metal-dependent hydrolase